MVPQCIYAYTQTSVAPYPGFVNLSVREDCSHPILIVRAPGQQGLRSADIPLPLDRMEELAKSMLAYVESERAKKT
jgi:hypothetical protein